MDSKEILSSIQVLTQSEIMSWRQIAVQALSFFPKVFSKREAAVLLSLIGGTCCLLRVYCSLSAL